MHQQAAAVVLQQLYVVSAELADDGGTVGCACAVDKTKALIFLHQGSVGHTLRACGIATERDASFLQALNQLTKSEILRVC